MIDGSRDTSGGDELGRAQETITRQSAEIERLRRRLEDERFAEELARSLSLASASGTLASPVTHGQLLEMIVETAAHVISARAAALFLVAEETQELIFEVALGQKAAEVKKFRVPLGHGIAGLVAVTGQPMAIANAQDDPRLSDIGKSIGYTPQTVLCVPLYYADDIIGVLELLDKEDASSFSNADMAALGLFANQAAVAIQLSRAHNSLNSLLLGLVQSLEGAPDSLFQRAREFTRALEEDDAAYRRSLDLARLVHEIAWQGEGEAAACRQILQSFAEYLRQRPGFPETGGML